MKKVLILVFFIVISIAGCSKGELVLSDPTELDAPVQDARLIGSLGKDELVFFTESGKKIYTYDLKEEQQKEVAKDAESYFVDPNTGVIFYSRMSKESTLIKEVMAIVDGSEQSLGKLEEWDYVENHGSTTSAYFKGMYFFVIEDQDGNYEGIEVFPVDGEYDPKLFEKMQQAFENNTYHGVVSDGERLIVLSNLEQKIYDYSTGEKEVLVDLSDVSDYDYGLLVDVSEEKVVYTVFQGGDENRKASTHIVTDDGEEEFDGLWGNTLDYLDESRIVAWQGFEFDGFLYSVSTNTGIKYELDTSVLGYTILDDKIVYQVRGGGLRYIEIGYE
ncbi:hypothetical protein [Ornithinibacillus californiensis]|uniref:hypothetical protein n=1 Tax=Ornithinibacillus californiensis TaxID=161536 RepID=UPI00064DAD07|nr:hypothetical protein [Ornithinibacillus californiensis]